MPNLAPFPVHMALLRICFTGQEYPKVSTSSSPARRGAWGLPWCNCVCRRNSEEILWSSCGLRAVFMFVLSVGRRRAGVRIGGWFSPRDKCPARAHTTMECFCSFVPEAAIRASLGNAPAPMPPNQCRRRQDTRCSGVSDPEMGPAGRSCAALGRPPEARICAVTAFHRTAGTDHFAAGSQPR